MVEGEARMPAAAASAAAAAAWSAGRWCSAGPHAGCSCWKLGQSKVSGAHEKLVQIIHSYGLDVTKS